MANLIEAVSVKNPYGIYDTCSHIRTEQRSTLTISDCMPYTGKYAYQFWIRSTLPQTISFKCDTTYKKFDVSTEWAYFSIIFDVATIGNIRLELPKGQYWIYNMKLEIGSYLTDWSPHPEDKTGSYDLLIENIENILLQHSSTIESTRSIVDKVNQEISNSVTKTTFESTVYGLQTDLSERFGNIEDGYGKWHLAIYDKSEFKDTKLDDEVDDRERADMGIFALDNSNINPKEEVLVLDNSVAMRVNSVNKILLYTGWAKFSESTTLSVNCSHHKGSIYLNGLKIFTSNNLTTDTVVFDFNEGWNLIQMVGNESNFSFNTKISQHKNCEIFNCLMGVPTGMETKIREQGAYLNIYLDKIMSEVFDIETTTGVDGITHSRITGSKITQSSDAIDFLVHRSYDEESHESSFSITPEGIQAITDDFIIKDERGSAVIVSGGNIHAQSITTAMLNTNAIKSLNYLDYGAEVPEDETAPEFDADSNPDNVHYSVRGTFLDLANGILQSPSLYVDGANAYFRGTVHATDGVFNGTVYATDGSFTGTVYATDGSFTGTVYATNGEFRGTVYASAGKFTGELESSSALLGPWHLTQDALYKGSSVFGTYGNGNIYFGNHGMSLSDRLLYDATNGSLTLSVDSLAIGPRSVQETILESGTRVYYINTVPTTQNAPAADWISNQEADIHVDDLCVDKTTGKTYQFVQTSGKRFKITFSNDSYINPADYVEIYFLYNSVYYKVVSKITGDAGGREIVIPVPKFYVYWHIQGPHAQDYEGFTIESVTAVDLITPLNTSQSPVNLPGYPVDESLEAGTYPQSDHPYSVENEYNKVWYVQTGLENVLAYNWVEIENAELTATTYTANRTEERLNSFLNNDWENMLISNDSKIETWYQADDPSKSLDPDTEEYVWNEDWDTEAKRQKHIGDIWYSTTNQKYYRWNGTQWSIMEAEPPQEILDTIDGKSTTFVGNSFTNELGQIVSYPPNPQRGDLWFIDNTQPIFTFNGTDWVEMNKYSRELDNFIQNEFSNLQVLTDSKIETWYQTEDPRGELVDGEYTIWSTDTIRHKHIGDIWYNPTAQTYRIYTVTEEDGETLYIWENMTAEPPAVIMDKIDGKAQVFTSEPYTPYYEGDLWVNASFTLNGTQHTNEIMRCQTTQESGNFSLNDWILASKYTDDSNLNQFINTTYANAITTLQQQTDQKAETWYQDEDPSVSRLQENPPYIGWATDLEKALHVGDIWYNPTDETYKIYTSTTKNDVTTYSWEVMKTEPPSEIMDVIDGKAQIFVAQPTNDMYYRGDLWVNATYSDQNVSYSNDILKAKRDRASLFDISDWELASKYTDDSNLTTFLNGTFANLQADVLALDNKAETWYQSSDPSDNWDQNDYTKHTGDIWCDSDTGVYYMWMGDSWDEMKTTPPDGIMDVIDGKAQIFFAQPNNEKYYAGDLWVNATYNGNGVSYNNDILRCQTESTGTTFNISDWTLASKYTDDSSLSSFINNEFASLSARVASQEDGKAETFRQSTDPAGTKNSSGTYTSWNADWTTAEDRARHIADIWCDTTTNTYYMWTGTAWEEMKTTPPAEIMDVIDGKAQIFFVQPNNQAYYRGDLWVNATYPSTGTKIYDNDILRCKTDSTGTTFNINDWDLASKYTDDTVANQAIADAAQAAKTADNYIYYDASHGVVVHTNGELTSSTISNITGPNVRLISDALGIYNSNTLIASYGSTTNFYSYDSNGNRSTAATLGSTGLNIAKGSITLGSKFAVTSEGVLTASDVSLTGGITATSGTIAGFHIVSTANTGTSANGGHVFANSLYRHAGDGSTYEYEFGMKGDATENPSSTNTTASNYAFYVKRIAKGGNWGSSATDMFYVRHDGKLYAKNAEIEGNITATSGTIGGCVIENNVLKIDKINVNGLASDLSGINNNISALQAQYGTSTSSYTTRTKIVTCSGFVLNTGASITVYFSDNSQYYSDSVQLNVNGTGAKDIYVNGSITSATNQFLWGPGAVITFRYNGTGYVPISDPRTWYGTSTNYATDQTKSATSGCDGCVVCKGTVVTLSMTNNNTNSAPQLSIKSTGAKNIYVGNGTTQPTEANGYGWTAGSTVSFMFDGQYWRMIDTSSLDKAKEAGKTATNYLYYSTTDGLVIHTNAVGQTGTTFVGTNAGPNTRLTGSSLDIYYNNIKLASYGQTTTFYSLTNSSTGTTAVAATLGSTGLNIVKGSITLGSYFSVATDGTITASNGTIGGWTITSEKLYNGTLGGTSSLHMSTTNLSTTIASKARNDWRLTVGKYFGVTSDGGLFSNYGQVGPFVMDATNVTYASAFTGVGNYISYDGGNLSTTSGGRINYNAYQRQGIAIEANGNFGIGVPTKTWWDQQYNSGSSYGNIKDDSPLFNFCVGRGVANGDDGVFITRGAYDNGQGYIQTYDSSTGNAGWYYAKRIYLGQYENAMQVFNKCRTSRSYALADFKIRWDGSLDSDFDTGVGINDNMTFRYSLNEKGLVYFASIGSTGLENKQCFLGATSYSPIIGSDSIFPTSDNTSPIYIGRRDTIFTNTYDNTTQLKYRYKTSSSSYKTPNIIRCEYYSPNDETIIYLGGDSSNSNNFSKLYIKAANIYNASGTAITSDRNMKNSFTDIPNYSDFIMNLKPQMFKFNNGNRFHTGFVAQDVESVALDTIGDFGIFCNVTDNNDTIHMLRYDEFIAPHIAVTQDHERKIKELEDEVADLKSQIKELLSKIG